jgi:hypothetical protein
MLVGFRLKILLQEFFDEKDVKYVGLIKSLFPVIFICLLAVIEITAWLLL